MPFLLTFAPVQVLLAEAAVIASEVAAYRLLWREDGAQEKAVKYAVIANLASCLGGAVFVLVEILFF